jgi:hypothetical protein
MSTSTVNMHSSPPLELNPVPTKRVIFRDVLTRGGGLIKNGEAEPTTVGRDRSVELLDLSDRNEFESGLPSTSNAPNRTLEQIVCNESAIINADPLHDDKLDDSHIPPDLFDFHTTESPPTYKNLLYTGSTPPASTTYPLDITIASSTAPSTPSAHSVSTDPTPPAIKNIGDSPRLGSALNGEPVVVSALSSLEPENDTPCLLDINTNFNSPPSGALKDLAGFNVHSSLDDLLGLNFQESTLPATLLDPNLSGQEEAASEDLFTETIIFQDRCSRRQTSDSKIKRAIAAVDPDLADRAFRIFSQGIKSQKS